jgi:hypothetical protein
MAVGRSCGGSAGGAYGASGPEAADALANSVIAGSDTGRADSAQRNMPSDLSAAADGGGVRYGPHVSHYRPLPGGQRGVTCRLFWETPSPSRWGAGDDALGSAPSARSAGHADPKAQAAAIPDRCESAGPACSS